MIIGFPVLKPLRSPEPDMVRVVYQAWIEIHRVELMRDWDLAIPGQPAQKIEPLR
jgi:hypothetical protein